MKDSFLTINGPSTGEYKEKGSKFFSYAFPVKNTDEVDQCLEQVKKEHFKSRHHCYAYRLTLDGSVFRINDDGEPSGTAGKPIFGQLINRNITNVFVVVVRYFGGVKLGTSGLIRSYKEASIDALEKCEIIEELVKTKVELTFGYDMMGQVMNALKACEIELSSKSFEDIANVVFYVRNTQLDEYILKLKSKILDKSIEEVKGIKEVPGLKMTYDT